MSKILNEPWILRVEDIDTARVKVEYRERQLQDLADLGLVPDSVITQSANSEFHFKLFEQARSEGLVYPCDCSRQDVLEDLRRLREAPHSEPFDYSGHCRNRPNPSNLAEYSPKETLAWRWKSSDTTGRNDAIVARTGPDGNSFAAGYHWACATDDAAGGYRLLVRAWDLASAEKTQEEIRHWRGCTQTKVFHTSLVVQPTGQRLEKRTRGVTLDEIRRSGISTEMLIEMFSRSFDSSKAISLSGEPRRQVTTDDLGLFVTRNP